MFLNYSILLIILAKVSVLFAKSSHPVPTYFGQRNPDGTVIDRNDQNYDKDIKKPFIHHISRNDAAATITFAPNPVKNGGNVTVTWAGVSKPQPKDFIAFYCPVYDNPTHYLDYFYVSDSSSWEAGKGKRVVAVYNMRTNCVFKYYRAGTSYSQLVAISDELTFDDGGHIAPLQGHLSMTTSPTEMRVSWVSGEVNEPAVVKYGLDKSLLMREYEVVVKTYTADSFCMAPANSTGFWHPGYIFDVLLKDLEPKTKYYYAFGTESQMSEIFTFTTPIPAGDDTQYKMIVYGDMGTDGYPQASETSILIQEEIKKNDVKFVFHHGDISYARGQAYVWEQWFYLIEPYSTLIPYMIGIGNHEQDHTTGGEKDPSGAHGEGTWHPSWFNGGVDSGGECGVAMFKRFHMPDNGNHVWWYSFDYGLVHYIMMSTEHDFSPGSRQYMWLENNLKSVDRSITPWILIGGHRAMYCSSESESDYVVSVNMQRLFEGLLYKYKVDLALWAHYHLYERTCKLYEGKCSDDGITHIVIGSAGKSLDPDRWYEKDWSVFHKTAYGYGRITVANSTSLLFEWIENDKEDVEDHVWITK